MTPRLHAVTPADTRDPLEDARRAANAEIDAMLDALSVALMHRTRAEHYRELLQPGVMQLAERLAETIAATGKAITAIRERRA